MPDPFKNARLVRQSYGIAIAQGSFGGPRGVWLECISCPQSQRITGVDPNKLHAAPDRECAAVFRRHGWTGKGDRMAYARCPACSPYLARVRAYMRARLRPREEARQ